MLLTIDIGNTNITLGLYEGKELGPRWRLATAYDHMPDEYGLQLLGLLQHAGHTPAAVDGICLASVVPPITSKIIEACRRYLNLEPLVVDAGVKTGVRVRYEDGVEVSRTSLETVVIKSPVNEVLAYGTTVETKTENIAGCGSITCATVCSTGASVLPP